MLLPSSDLKDMATDILEPLGYVPNTILEYIEEIVGEVDSHLRIHGLGLKLQQNMLARWDD